MDKETAKKFEKDLSTLLEKYGMKKKGSACYIVVLTN